MSKKAIVPIEVIENKILLIRGQKVLLSSDLAELYGVEVRVLVQAVKRNIKRFPSDFMFQLTKEEYSNLKSQFVISSWGGARRATPYAFTEQGVAMLSSVLNSEKAILVNIFIMRTFVKMREILLTHKELALKLKELVRRIVSKSKMEMHDGQIKAIFEVINQLLSPNEPPKKKIGFIVEEKRVRYFSN
jgi:hypothetical protein